MRNTAVLPLAFLSVVALALAAGCANGNVATSGGAPTPAPVPTVSCLLPAGEQAVLVFPIPEQSLAPNLQGIVIAVSPAPLPTNWYFYSESPYGSTYGTNSIGFFSTPAPATASSSPSPLPTPSAPTTFTIFESASNGTFALSSASPSPGPDTVKIYIANSSCHPGVYLGEFTTATHDIPTPSPTPTST